MAKDNKKVNSITLIVVSAIILLGSLTSFIPYSRLACELPRYSASTLLVISSFAKVNLGSFYYTLDIVLKYVVIVMAVLNIVSAVLSLLNIKVDILFKIAKIFTKVMLILAYVGVLFFFYRIFNCVIHKDPTAIAINFIYAIVGLLLYRLSAKNANKAF